MTTAVRTPLAQIDALALGQNLWKKSIIRQGKIRYSGGEFDVSPDYLDSVMAAFHDKAIDSVPFVFVDDKGSHSEAPERWQGKILGLERTPDGIDAVIALSDTANSLVEQDPDFGVSVLIKHNQETGDGRVYPAFLAHVAGTFNPILRKLGKWSKVPELAASNGDVEVLDLLALTAPPDSQPAIAGETNGEPVVASLSDALSPEDIEKLKQLLATLNDPDEDESNDESEEDGPADDAESGATDESGYTVDQPDDDPDEDAEGEDENGESGELSDEDIRNIIESVLPDLIDDTADVEIVDEAPEPADEVIPVETSDVREPELVAASNGGDNSGGNDSLALAQERQAREDADLRLAQVERKLAENEYAAERERFAREYGITPRVTDIVKPLLLAAGGQGGNSIALSNGESSTVADLVRQFVKAVAETPRLDLSHPVGSAVDLSPDEAADEATARKALAAEYVAGLR